MDNTENRLTDEQIEKMEERIWYILDEVEKGDDAEEYADEVNIKLEEEWPKICEQFNIDKNSKDYIEITLDISTSYDEYDQLCISNPVVHIDTSERDPATQNYVFVTIMDKDCDYEYDYNHLDYPETIQKDLLSKELLDQKVNNFKILMIPSYDLGEQYLRENQRPEATVEAEYGDKVIVGSRITLAHHGSRSANPAPCNTEVDPLNQGTIVMSHIDLDAIGGVMAVMGIKPEDQEFWKAAEYIDLNGIHHIHDLTPDTQDKINAIEGWLDQNVRARHNEITDVTDIIKEAAEKVVAVIDERHPDHEQMIEDGKAWVENVFGAAEKCLVSENSNVRLFHADPEKNPFCNANYYSENLQQVCPVVVAYYEKTHAITISLASDLGKDVSAKDIVQDLWGPEAGGHQGIAGSPRGREMTMEDAEKAAEYVNQILNEREQKIEVEKYMDIMMEKCDEKVLTQQMNEIYQFREFLSEEVDHAKNMKAMLKRFEENLRDSKTVEELKKQVTVITSGKPVIEEMAEKIMQEADAQINEPPITKEQSEIGD